MKNGSFGALISAPNLFPRSNEPGSRSQKLSNGEPKDLEGALLFLVNNEAAGFITGVVLPIDGGFQAYSGVQGRMGKLVSM
ncbi:MAG: hypothetical protein LIP12_16160 [Clostridiales bacterium]|nr:hypothetical protein [Clostridiales bacterium]